MRLIFTWTSNHLQLTLIILPTLFLKSTLQANAQRFCIAPLQFQKNEYLYLRCRSAHSNQAFHPNLKLFQSDIHKHSVK